SSQPTILVLGAAGLIGEFIANDLAQRGLPVRQAARRFTAGQRRMAAGLVHELPVRELDAAALTTLIVDASASIVGNCLGVLQDTPSDSTQDVHLGFVERLIAALRTLPRPVLLVHLSIPGTEAGDATPFARSKRAAEQRIAQSGLPYAILRPG